MTTGLYGAALLVSIAGMLTVDWRWKLALWRRPVPSIVALIIGVIFFLAWDLTGISRGIFFRGEGPYQTGLMLAPELPVEEIGFLVLLCECALVFAGLVERANERRKGRMRSRASEETS